MLHSLSERIADFLLRQKCFEEEMLPVYIYGVELFLSSVLGVVLVILSGCLLGEFISSIVFLLSFIILRLFTGGFHCNSYFKCNLSLVLTFVAVILLKDLYKFVPFQEFVLGFMMLSSLLITMLFSPVSHPNKEISKKDRVKFRLIALGVLLVHIAVIFVFSEFIGAEVIVITDFISGIYVIVGLIKNKRERSNDYET